MLTTYVLCVVTVCLMQESVVTRVAGVEFVDLRNVPGDEYGGFKFGIADEGFQSDGAGALGDVNGDGIDDFMSQKTHWHLARIDEVVAEVFLGKPSPFPPVLLVDKDEDWSFIENSYDAQTPRRFSHGPLELGDVNADNLNDIMIVTEDTSSCGSNCTTYAYILFGSREKKRTVNVDYLNGRNGFTIRLPNYHFFSGVARACGDFNNDGINDIVATTPISRFHAESYIIFGKKNRNKAMIDVSNLDGNDGFKVGKTCTYSENVFVAPIGDINGDGFAEAGLGSCGIVYGTSNFLAAEPSTIRFTEIIYSSGTQNHSLRVEGIGDINGDNLDDIVGTFSSDRVVIVFGSKGGLPTYLHVNELDGSNGFIVDNSWNPIGIGDFNGDKIDDMLFDGIGINHNIGENWIVYGKTTPFVARSSSPECISNIIVKNVHGFRGNAALGDVNNDGLADVLLGSASYNSSRFENHLPPTAIFGKRSPGNSSGGMGAKVIVGISVGTVFGALLLGVGVYAYLRKRAQVTRDEYIEI